MKVSKKKILNILLFAFILSFFVTPLGYHSKVWLNQILAPGADIIPEVQRDRITSYNWKLKDDQWNYFNFEKEKGKVVFINFFASWRLPCAAELADIQELYEELGDEISFYIITDEERSPVEEFMEKNDFTFPVTYQIIGEPSPIEIPEPPATYVLDKDGNIAISQQGIGDWDTRKMKEFLKELAKG